MRIGRGAGGKGSGGGFDQNICVQIKLELKKQERQYDSKTF